MLCLPQASTRSCACRWRTERTRVVEDHIGAYGSSVGASIHSSVAEATKSGTTSVHVSESQTHASVQPSGPLGARLGLVDGRHHLGRIPGSSATGPMGSCATRVIPCCGKLWRRCLDGLCRANVQ